MRTPLRHEVLNHVFLVIALVKKVLVVVQRRDRDLARQIRRAMNGVNLNVSEGFGTQAGNARVRFESARGSLYETEAGIQAARAWGYVTEAEVAEVLRELSSLGARVYGLSKKN